MNVNNCLVRRIALSELKDDYVVKAFEEFAAEFRKNKSKAAAQLIKNHYDAMTESNRRNLIKLWDEMTPEQRLNPNRE